MALDTFRGVPICILVRGTGYGDVLVGSRVMVLRRHVDDAGRVSFAQKCSINRIIADLRHILGKFAGLPHGQSSRALRPLKLDVTGTRIVVQSCSEVHLGSRNGFPTF